MAHCGAGRCVLGVSARFYSVKAKYVRVMFILLGLAVMKEMVARNMDDSATRTGSSRK